MCIHTYVCTMYIKHTKHVLCVCVYYVYVCMHVCPYVCMYIYTYVGRTLGLVCMLVVPVCTYTTWILYTSHKYVLCHGEWAGTSHEQSQRRLQVWKPTWCIIGELLSLEHRHHRQEHSLLASVCVAQLNGFVQACQRFLNHILQLDTSISLQGWSLT